MLQGGVDLVVPALEGVRRRRARACATASTSPSAASARAAASAARTAATPRCRSCSPATSTGRQLFGAGRARAGSTPAASSARSSESTPAVAHAAMEDAREARHLRLVRSQLPRLALAVGRRQGAGARGEPVADAVRRRAVRQRGGLLGGARLRARGRRRELQGCCRPAAFRTMIDRAWSRRIPNITTVATTLRTVALGVASTAGAPSAGTRGSSTRSRSATSRSSTASAAATRSPRGSSTACSAARIPQWALECGVAHGALAMSTPGDTTMATFAEVMRAMKGTGGPRISTDDAAARDLPPHRRGRHRPGRARAVCRAGDARRRGGARGRHLDLRDHDDGARRARGDPHRWSTRLGRPRRRRRGHGARRGRGPPLHRGGRRSSSSARGSTSAPSPPRTRATCRSCPARSRRPR